MPGLPLDEPTRWLLGIPDALFLAWLAWWYSLQLARRAEFNALASGLRVHLRQIAEAQLAFPPHPLDADQLHQLERMLPWWRRRALRRGVAEFQAACRNTYDNQLGEVLLVDPKRVNEAARRLLPLLAHRG